MPVSPPDTPLSSGRSTAPPSPLLPCAAATPSAAAASSSSSSSTSSAADPVATQHVYTIRSYPIMLSVGREAAAASAGMDLMTYNLLMELQIETSRLRITTRSAAWTHPSSPRLSAGSASTSSAQAGSLRQPTLLLASYLP